jgi:hypothetical protein
VRSIETSRAVIPEPPDERLRYLAAISVGVAEGRLPMCGNSAGLSARGGTAGRAGKGWSGGEDGEKGQIAEAVAASEFAGTAVGTRACPVDELEDRL